METSAGEARSEGQDEGRMNGGSQETRKLAKGKQQPAGAAHCGAAAPTGFIMMCAQLTVQ